MMPFLFTSDLTVYVLYHDDSDGIASALSAYCIFDDKAKYISVNYNQPLPEMTLGDKTAVYILDFSYPREILEDLKSKVGFLKVIDHHETAMEQLKDLDYAMFDMNKSAARLSWEYFHGESVLEDVPYLIQLVEDRDLWRFNLPDSRALEAGMQSTGRIKDIRFWYDVLMSQSSLEKILETGRILVKNTMGILESFIRSKKFKVVNYKGYRAALCNLTSLISETAEALYNSPDLKLDMTISYFISSEGKMIFSFRSSKASGVNVGEIAKQLGGGGHYNASGAAMDLQVGTNFLQRLYT